MADTPFTPAPVTDKRTPPPGILPKNIQNWVLAGIAVLMIIVIALSGGSTLPKKESPAVQAGPAVDPNAARIQEYQKRIEDETRKLQIEQAQLSRTRESLGSSNAPALTNPVLSPYREANADSGGNYSQKESIRLEKEKRDYESLFASNVALTYRKESSAAQQPSLPLPSAMTADALAKVLPLYGFPTPFTPQAGLPPSTPPVSPPIPAVQQTNPAPERVLARPQEKLYQLFEGTVLETVLTNRLDGSFSGPVNCMVTTNVHSQDRMHLLIPQGSRVLGEVQKVETFGQERLAVFFHRLIMPDGYSINLDQFQGLNQIGETGLKDQINHHYLQVFGVSLAIGAIAGLGEANQRSRVDPSELDAYKDGVAASLSQSSLRILDRYLNVLPTSTIREGHRVKVFLSQDLSLPAYDKHPSGL